MKHLSILFAFCLLAITATKAQSPVIDTAVKYCIASKVQPVIIQTNFPNVDTITHVGYFTYTVIGDSAANVNWTLINKNRNIKYGDYYITPVQYATWPKTPESTLQILAVFFGLTFKTD